MFLSPGKDSFIFSIASLIPSGHRRRGLWIRDLAPVFLQHKDVSLSGSVHRGKSALSGHNLHTCSQPAPGSCSPLSLLPPSRLDHSCFRHFQIYKHWHLVVSSLSSYALFARRTPTWRPSSNIASFCSFPQPPQEGLTPSISTHPSIQYHLPDAILGTGVWRWARKYRAYIPTGKSI